MAAMTFAIICGEVLQNAEWQPATAAGRGVVRQSLNRPRSDSTGIGGEFMRGCTTSKGCAKWIRVRESGAVSDAAPSDSYRNQTPILSFFFKI